uniref:Leukemia inhibitory factor n=1 Tax=Pogona vitticeps TaxID=103695 RepID=A0A6J0SDM3_9SAUR
MQLTMKATFAAGVLPLLLATFFGLLSARAFPLTEEESMCRNVSRCKAKVLAQIHCQIAQLNMSAHGLFTTYLDRQGEPFTNHPDKFCKADKTFPAFDRTDSERNLLSLYKIFAFFNASLGNITRDQENLSTDDKEKEDLLRRLRNTTNMSRGLLANLTCLLCSRYKVHHVHVTYGNSSSSDIFQKKQYGCQVLKRYTEVISDAAYTMGKCSR